MHDHSAGLFALLPCLVSACHMDATQAWSATLDAHGEVCSPQALCCCQAEVHLVLAVALQLLACCYILAALEVHDTVQLCVLCFISVEAGVWLFEKSCHRSVMLLAWLLSVRRFSCA